MTVSSLSNWPAMHLVLMLGQGSWLRVRMTLLRSPDINLTLMQRNDEMADMINTTGTTFLGLTIGCARCHNHKFDPILQKDYYSMQAVFSGVQYGERMMPKENNEAAKQALVQLEKKVQSMSRELDVLKLISSTDSKRKKPLILLREKRLMPLATLKYLMRFRQNMFGSLCAVPIVGASHALMN